MPTMILQMTGVTALYVTVTVLLWRLWKKTEWHTLLQKLAVGLFYGLCSVAANHFGILYGDMILNVRDIGPAGRRIVFRSPFRRPFRPDALCQRGPRVPGADAGGRRL